MSFHACVWVDHENARIFQLTAHEATLTEAEDHRPPHHIHRSANHVGLGTVPMDTAMMADIAAQLGDAQAILIAGPGQARFALRTYLEEHHPEVGAKIWGVEPSDHPTDPEFVAWARSWFKAQDRMHEL